ncbi:hypothetical protein KIH41_07455 [Litoribacter ruber]|uniref:hypothetical protein n=1 Tax=Litoribacter ruber TaxID=702568 RepID=UPI001BDA2AD3|nr:hypothetical protein [Litoribacter ruber]MBT0811112.1 hypothetical protein [Litoribacter ruber]
MTTVKKFGLYFLFSYILLNTLLFPLELLPYLDIVNVWLNYPIEQLSKILWVDTSYMDNKFDLEEVDISDSFSNYLHWITKISLALFLSIFLLFIKIPHSIPSNAQSFLFTYIRYYLAFYMITYGLAKIFLIQFFSLNLTSYIVPIGDYSPYGLLWAFMEISEPYQIIGGILEFLGGILLFFRRTTLIGGLIILGVMSNVVMFNLFYGLPVKIISVNYLFMTFILISYNADKLFNFFISKKQVYLKEIPAINNLISKSKIYFPLKSLLVIYLLYFSLHNSYSNYEFLKLNKEEPVISGIYRIESTFKNGQDISNLIDESRNYKYLIFDLNYLGNIYMQATNYQDESSNYYINKPDETSFDWTSKKDSTNQFAFDFNIEQEKIYLIGIWQSDTLRISGRKLGKDNFPLMDRKIRLLRGD